MDQASNLPITQGPGNMEGHSGQEIGHKSGRKEKDPTVAGLEVEQGSGDII